MLAGTTGGSIRQLLKRRIQIPEHAILNLKQNLITEIKHNLALLDTINMEERQMLVHSIIVDGNVEARLHWL